MPVGLAKLCDGATLASMAVRLRLNHWRNAMIHRLRRSVDREVRKPVDCLRLQSQDSISRLKNRARSIRQLATMARVGGFTVIVDLDGREQRDGTGKRNEKGKQPEIRQRH